jgi:pyruvate/2-oxoglutarate dehydrogenase complex dihydrolipoamide acyltransferase (E2) component
MRTTIKLPKLSETVDEMIIVEWLVAVGDRVEMDQSILYIETDKATVELPAPVAGVLAEILVQPDDEVVTGAKLAVIETGD